MAHNPFLEWLDEFRHQVAMEEELASLLPTIDCIINEHTIHKQSIHTMHKLAAALREYNTQYEPPLIDFGRVL